MALAGHDTAFLVINDPATASVYSGTLNGVVAGERIVVVVAADGNGNAQDPATWTVTLGSDTLSHVVSNTTTVIEGITAIFAGTATASGNPTLTVDPVNPTRALTAHAFRISGFDTTTPHPKSGQNIPRATATSLTSPNGVTTAANGNAIIGVISIHGGDITGLAVGAADGSTTGNNGGAAFNDNTWGVAWDRTPTAAAVTFAWTWTGADRPGASWIEVAEAAAVGSAGTSAGASTVSAAGQAQASASGSAAGAATASAVIAATGSAAGSSAATGVGAALATAAGVASGQSTVAAAKWSGVDWIGAPAYWGGESATWTPGAASVATGTAAGVGVATAQGAAIATASGASAGLSVANGVPYGFAAGAGVASGAASVVGSGGAIVISAGAANGSSTAMGAANGAGTVVGVASGSVTVSGAGGSVAIAAGSATGFCVVTAVGGAISDAPRRVALGTNSRTGIIVLTPANGIIVLTPANGVISLNAASGA